MASGVRKLSKFLRANPVPIILAIFIFLFHVIRHYYGQIFYVVFFTDLLYLWFILSLLFRKSQYYQVFQWFTAIAVPVATLVITITFLVNPTGVDLFAYEDGPIEDLSGLVLFLGALIWLVWSIRQLWRREWLYGVIGLVLMFGLVVIGGEEISWGQRIFDIPSSQYFVENNWQGETNLHNLNTNISESIFYTIGPFVVVAVPLLGREITAFLRRQRGRLKGLRKLEAFVPPEWVGWAMITGMAFINHVNNMVRPTVMFVIVLLLALGLKRAIDYWRVNRRKALWAISLLVVFIITWTIFTISLWDWQQTGLRGWLSSEYLEFFIELGLLVYTIDFMFRNTKLLGGKMLK